MIFNDFDQEKFKEWYQHHAQEIFNITGIAHWNAPDARFLKIFYLQELRISQLEHQLSCNTSSQPINS